MDAQGMLPSSLPPRRWRTGDPSPACGSGSDLPADVIAALRLCAKTNLKDVPTEYGPSGLWLTVQRRNPFEVLLLDAAASVISNDEVVARFRFLTDFWNQKIAAARQGAARTVIRQKYGDNLEIYIENVRWAYDQLSTPEGIAHWRDQLEKQRLQAAWTRIRDVIEATLVDGLLDPAEVGHLVSCGEAAGYSREEFAGVLRQELRAGGFEPDTPPIGDTELQRIQSVRWAAPEVWERLRGDDAGRPRGTLQGSEHSMWPAPAAAMPAGASAAQPIVHPSTPSPTIGVPIVQPPSRLGLIISVVSVVLIAAAITVYWLSFNTFERRIAKALAKGNLFTPPGACVADLWMAEHKRDPESSALRSAADDIRAVLAPKADDAFARWYRDSDETIDWDQMWRTCALLEVMFPADTTFKIRAKYAEAQKLLRVSDYSAALGAYNAVLSLDGCNALALNGIGKIYIRDDSPLRDKARGVEYYQRATQCDPKFTWSLTNLGTHYMLDGKWQMAEQYMLMALQTSPGRPSILRSLGRVSFNLKRYPQAVEYYQQSLASERDPELIARAHSSIAQIREKMR